MSAVVANKKRQVDEIRRCARDPIYFFNTYCRISHPVRGPVAFKTYPFQDECTRTFNDAESRFVIVNKSRQLGLSTLTAAYALWYVLFRRNKEVLIIATKLKTAQNFIRKVKFMLKNLPKWLIVPSITGDNKTTLEFGSPSNSKIEAVPTSTDAGRSEALSLLIVDEAAHIKDFAELWKGLYPTLSTGGRAIVISTPKGHGNHFHELWSKGQSGANEFKCIELPWTVHPEHDQAWFDKETKNMDRAAIAQEMNCDFLASGETYLEIEEIEWIGQNVRKAMRRDGPDMNVWVWADPIRDDEVKYILSGDCASGRGNDFSTFHIINATLGEIVAEYKGKIQPDHFADIINTFARRYNNALVSIERNTGWGQHANTHLIKNCGYTHIYFDNKKHPIPMGDYIPPDMIPDAGFDTSPSSRPKILAKMEEIIRSKQIKIYSSRLYDELKSFVMLNNKPQAQKNCNDDLVLALAIGLWIFDVSSVNSQFATKLNAAMLAGFGMTSNDFQNMAGNGNEVLPKWTSLMPYVGGNTGPNNNRNRPKRDDHTDLTWLLGK